MPNSFLIVCEEINSQWGRFPISTNFGHIGHFSIWCPFGFGGRLIPRLIWKAWIACLLTPYLSPNFQKGMMVLFKSLVSSSSLPRRVSYLPIPVPSSRQFAVRCAGLAFDCPTNAEQRSEDLTGSGWRPWTHAETANTSLSSGISSPCSSLSARTRKANASAFEIASFRLSPHAITPGSSGISAIQRPPSSLSIPIFM